MAEIFDVVYPQVGRATFEGGLNNKYPPAIIADSESPDCLNVYAVNGAVETRGGSAKLNTTPIGTYAIDGLYTRKDNSGTETMVAFCKGSAWQLGTTTFTTIASAQSVFTAGVQVAAVNYLNRLYCDNGGVVPYKYDGANFTRQGVYPPTATISAASNGTGAVNPQDWVYCYTWMNSAAVEGNISPLSATFTVSSPGGHVNLTNIGVAPQSYGVSSRRIYRATTPAGPFLLVGSIADNTTTTFTDNVSAASLTAAAPTDAGVPPSYNAVVQFQQRLFMNDTANPNFVWYTEILTPFTVKSTSFEPFGDGAFDLVKGLAVYNNCVLVLSQNSMWLWLMPDTDPTDWQVIKILSQYGSKSPFSTWLYDNQCMVAVMQNGKFAGFAAVSQGAVTLERTNLETSLTGSDRTTDRIEPDMFQVPEAFAGLINAIAYKNKAYVALPFGSSATANNRVYVFDFSHSQMSTDATYPWSPLATLNAAMFTIYGGLLYYGDSTATGLVYQLETASQNDNGAAINSYFWTKEFSGAPGHENLQKDFRKAKLLVDMAGAYYMNLTFRTDSDKGAGTTVQVYLNDNNTVSWGHFPWGAGQWGSGTNQSEVTIPIGPATGKRIQFQFSNQNAANQRFKVHGLNFTYNVKGKR